MENASLIPVKQTGSLVSRPIFNVFGSLQREIDRLLENFEPNIVAGRSLNEVRARMDLAEGKDGLELTVELPGLEEKDVNVAVSDGVLTVSGEKKHESEQKDKNYQFVERSYGSFSRSIALPPGVTADQINATLSKGVLKVTVPTPAKPEPKQIAVKTA
jgi:HSP20 family protein